jgi:hypothetical protein
VRHAMIRHNIRLKKIVLEQKQSIPRVCNLRQNGMFY